MSTSESAEAASGGKPRPRILLADDEPHVRVYLKSVLRRLDAEIVGEAANGVEALRAFRETRPDLLLMDLNMPIRNGEEALQDIMTEFPDARVVMLSSLANRASVEKCVELGAVHYLRKDTPSREILEIVEECLRDPT